MARVEAYLDRHLAAEKSVVLERAIRTKALGILSQAVGEVELHIRTLEVPLEDLASKAEAFAHALKSVVEQRRTTRDLLAGDQRRLQEDLERRIDTLRTMRPQSSPQSSTMKSRRTPGARQSVGR
jgi:hypothetical protein